MNDVEQIKKGIDDALQYSNYHYTLLTPWCKNDVERGFLKVKIHTFVLHYQKIIKTNRNKTIKLVVISYLTENIIKKMSIFGTIVNFEGKIKNFTPPRPLQIQQ